MNPGCTNTNKPDAACRRQGAFRGLGADEIAQRRATKLARVKGYAPRQVGRFRRAFEGNSLRAAVDAMCVECMGYVASDVAGCTAPACPLWGYRPDGGEPEGKRA